MQLLVRVLVETPTKTKTFGIRTSFSLMQSFALELFYLIINASDLHPVTLFFVKYADDVFLFATSTNFSRIPFELLHFSSWDSFNDNTVIKSQTQELIIVPKSAHRLADSKFLDYAPHCGTI